MGFWKELFTGLDWIDWVVLVGLTVGAGLGGLFIGFPCYRAIRISTKKQFGKKKK